MTACGGITYWLAEHQAVVGFRWSPAHSWGSTWSFLVSSVAVYALLAATFEALLRLLRRTRPVPLGPLPVLHSLAMALASAAIFLGLLLSAAAEIRDARWYWRGRSGTTPLRWLLCFPPGTRSSGRVFFWSYAFYLSRFLHLLGTFLSVLRRRAALAGVLRHSALICMSFLWLEFSQSFQVIAILAFTLAHTIVFGYRFWAGVGLPVVARKGAAVVLGCKVALTGCNAACHLGFVLLHFAKGGCNGIGAWVFNSVLNSALLLCYLKMEARKKKGD
ncbi:hypothetical protein Cni_G24187 [Canna indica]|uniref:Elongation of fatty acids protein 3-like n=1 Tax=Canna indica TaxID=4628 RepID=A0AAQ3QN73_9LILI|nr:hypothetical protein Cni_G24187 [Canna indica]